MNRRSYKGPGNPFWKGGYDTGCTQCGKEVHVKPSRAHRDRFFCSRECSSLWASANICGEQHWRFQGGTVERVCQQCKRPFKQRLAEFNRNPGKFCSQVCMGQNKNSRKTVKCQVCQAEFRVRLSKLDGRYCSRDCKRAGQIKTRTEKEIACRRLAGRMSSLLGASLRGKKKGRRWQQLVGYSIHDLMTHLESKFTDGMTWENIGKWHVDHIRPRSSFSYDSVTDAEFLACWALGNLQPLWAVDNLRKGSKLNYKVG